MVRWCFANRKCPLYRFFRRDFNHRHLQKEKRRAEALPGPQGRKKTTLLGTNPDRYYFSFPRASIVRPDFHWLAVLNPSVRTHAGKTGHSNFDLKFRASREKAVSFHWMFFKLVKRFPAGCKLHPLALIL